MATLEEQKSTLQSSRQKTRTSWNSVNDDEKKRRLAQARNQQTRNVAFEVRRKEFGVNDPNIKNELLSQKNASGSKQDLFDVADLQSKRRAALFSNRLQAFANRPSSDNSESAQTENESIEPQRQPLRTTNIIKQTAQRRFIQQQALEAAVPPQIQDQRNTFQKLAKQKARRGIIYVVNILATAFDLSTLGVSFLIDVFVYMFSFGWLNLEMVYGTHIAKKKSKYVSPISWDPIPMPVDKEAHILQGLLLAADLALIIGLLVFTFMGFCFLHDFIKFTTSPLQFGTSLASGGNELCLGGIISSIFGL